MNDYNTENRVSTTNLYAHRCVSVLEYPAVLVLSASSASECLDKKKRRKEILPKYFLKISVIMTLSLGPLLLASWQK